MYPKGCTNRNLCKKQTNKQKKNPPTFAVKKNIWQLCMAVLSISIQHVCFLWMWASQVSPVTLVCSFLESSSPFTNQDQKKSWIMTSQKLWLHMLTMYMALPIQKANTKPQCEQQGFSEFVNFFFLNWNFCECIFLFHVYQTGQMKLLCLGSALITHTWNSPLFKTLKTDQDQDM